MSKRLRDSGLGYESIKITKADKNKKIVERPAKKLLPPCSQKCRLKCSEKFKEEVRQKIFHEYWDMANLQRQRDFIASSMGSIAPKFARADRRRLNHTFNFKLDHQKR